MAASWPSPDAPSNIVVGGEEESGIEDERQFVDLPRPNEPVTPGEEIRTLRKAMRLSQRAFGLQVGRVHYKTVDGWERDKFLPNWNHRRRIRQLQQMVAHILKEESTRRYPLSFKH